MESENYTVGEIVELKEPRELLHKEGTGEVLMIRDIDRQALVSQNGNIVMYSFDQLKKVVQ